MPLVAAAVFCGASWYFLKSRGEHKPNFLRGSENHFVLVVALTIFVTCRLTKYLYLFMSKSIKSIPEFYIQGFFSRIGIFFFKMLHFRHFWGKKFMKSRSGIYIAPRNPTNFFSWFESPIRVESWTTFKTWGTWRNIGHLGA